MAKLYELKTGGYVKLGSREHVAYDFDPHGYVDLAVTMLDIKTQESTYTFASEADAQAVADWITSEEAADEYGVVVREAWVEEMPEAEDETTNTDL